MLVTSKKYNSLRIEFYALSGAFSDIMNKYNLLVMRINKLGGEDFLRGAKIPENTPQIFSREEIKRLILLCHPDKHGGKEMSHEITKKLLLLRDQS